MNSSAPIKSDLAIGLVTLGCAKNAADSENMLGLLQSAGYKVTASLAQADICIVNTCTFIAGSTRQSIDQIFELTDAGKEVIVAGCLAQRYGEKLFTEIPSIRALIGTGSIESIGEAVHWISHHQGQKNFIGQKSGYIAQGNTPRLRLSGGLSAYVKIAEGCNHRCSFCIIPQLRGKLQSRPVQDIVDEAKGLAAEGFQEIVLISQDSSAYGIDLNRGYPQLDELLYRLDNETTIPWIRLMYWYPAGLRPNTLKLIAKAQRILPYIDIPLQHSHPALLANMRRPTNAHATISMIRDLLPDAIIRSTFIVGYPGETDEHFAHLQDFIINCQFDRLGIFTYSPEGGTAAAALPNQLSEKIKKQRRNHLMRLQASISLAKNQKLIGHKDMALFLRREDDLLIGRSWRDAPDIDGQIICHNVPDDVADRLITHGQITPVLIENADEYDLYAKIIDL